MNTTLEQAREARWDRELDELINERIKSVKLAAPISPHARIKLRGILKKYAKEDHPFRACVTDNMKRFGPGRTEAVCATLKDVIKGNKDWRKGGRHSAVAASEDSVIIDAEVLLALDALSDRFDLQELFLEARALEEYGTKEAVVLLDRPDGRAELERWGNGSVLELAATTAAQRHAKPKSAFVFPDEEGYMIDTRKLAANALSRAAQNETGARLKKVQDMVCARYPDLPFCVARRSGNSGNSNSGSGS